MIRTILATLFFVTTLMANTNICVSIPPQAFFVKKIAGSYADVTVLIPPGSSPAAYTPKPSQLKAIKNASVYFTIGVPFEKNWLARFQSINPNLKVIDMTKGITKKPLHNPIETHEHDHHHDALDPHVWLSPTLSLALAKNVLETLSTIDPKHKKYFEENYQKFQKEVHELKEQITQKLQNLKNRTFIVFHPSFGYFADEFNLHQVAIEKEGKEPSLKYIKRVIDYANKNHIKTIFVEPQFSQKSARYIARQIDGEVASIDPLAYEWDTNLMDIANSLEKANRHQR